MTLLSFKTNITLKWEEFNYKKTTGENVKFYCSVLQSDFSVSVTLSIIFDFWQSGGIDNIGKNLRNVLFISIKIK